MTKALRSLEDKIATPMSDELAVRTPAGRLENPQHRERKETMSTQTWFITGASSGLGASVANAAWRAGHRVAVPARDEVRLEKLTEAHPDAVLPLSMDLTKPSEIKAAIITAEKWHGGIDVLVNNAALGYLAAIEEGEEQNIRTLFDTNVFGVPRQT